MPDGDFVGVQALPGRVSKFAPDGTPDLAWGHRVFRSLAIPNTYLRDSVEGVGVINPDPGHVIGVEAGNQHTCALVAYNADPNQAWCWGSNNAGQLGQPAFGEVSTSLSVQSSLGVDPQVLAAGGDQTCAVSQGGGQPTCFGDVSSGAATPPDGPALALLDPQGTGWETRGLSAGGEFTCGLALGGGASHVKCWGGNADGQLGEGESLQCPGGEAGYVALQNWRGSRGQTLPVPHPAQVSAGLAHACVLTESAIHVYCAGGGTIRTRCAPRPGLLRLRRRGGPPSGVADPGRRHLDRPERVRRGAHPWSDGGRLLSTPDRGDR